MKKIIGILITVPLILIITGCRSQIDANKVMERFTDEVANIQSYTLTGRLQMQHADDTMQFNVTTEFLYPSFYRVTLDNTQNNNRQIIIKNNDGVFVLTPILNKVFKFDSNWPENSSHIYLLSSLARDIIADDEATGTIDGNEVTIKTKTAHKTNVNLTNQRITICPTSLSLKRVAVYDNNDNWQIRFEVSDFDTTRNIQPRDFHVEQTMANNISQMGSGRLAREEGTLDVSNLIDDTTNVERSITEDLTIKTFSGDRNFTIITNRITPSVFPIPTRIHQDLALFSRGIAAFSENAMTFLHKDKEVTIVSSQLQPYEFIDIAASLSWTRE